MSASPTQHHYPGPDKCVVYWDYENIAIPRGCALRTVIGVLKERIWAKVGPKQIPIHFKLYIRATKLNPHLSEEMDINGVEHINISSKKPESVDKRMLIDIALQLYELEKCKKSNAIALISGDKDFGHLLSRIHKEQPISHSLLILLNKDQSVNPNLSNNVDFVINDFHHQTFTICRNNNCQYQHMNCPYYHPTNNYYPTLNVHKNHKNHNKNASKKYRKKRKRHDTHNKYNNSSFNIGQPNKRQRIDMQTNSNTNTNNAEYGSDSSIEIIEKCRISVKMLQLGTDRTDTIQVHTNEKVKAIMRQLKMKYNDIDTAALGLQFGDKSLVEDEDIGDCGVGDGDTISWYVKEGVNDDKVSENKHNGLMAMEEDGAETESENENIVNGNEGKAPPLDLMQRRERRQKGANHNDMDDIIDLT